MVTAAPRRVGYEAVKMENCCLIKSTVELDTASRDVPDYRLVRLLQGNSFWLQHNQHSPQQLHFMQVRSCL